MKIYRYRSRTLELLFHLSLYSYGLYCRGTNIISSMILDILDKVFLTKSVVSFML